MADKISRAQREYDAQEERDAINRQTAEILAGYMAGSAQAERDGASRSEMERERFTNDRCEETCMGLRCERFGGHHGNHTSSQPPYPIWGGVWGNHQPGEHPGCWLEREENKA